MLNNILHPHCWQDYSFHSAQALSHQQFSLFIYTNSLTHTHVLIIRQWLNGWRLRITPISFCLVDILKTKINSIYASFIEIVFNSAVPHRDWEGNGSAAKRGNKSSQAPKGWFIPHSPNSKVRFLLYTIVNNLDSSLLHYYFTDRIYWQYKM